MDVGVKRAMREHSEKTILLVDSSKINQKGLVKTFNIDEIDIIITNDDLQDDLVDQIKEIGVKLDLVPYNK